MSEFGLEIGGVSIERFLIAILLIVIVFVVANGLTLVLRRLFSKKLSKHNAKILSFLIQSGFIILVIYYGVYKMLDLNLGSFAASLGVLTIALAFSSQQIVQNFIAGMILTFQKSVEIGDWVDIGPGTGMARVKDISMMRTTVRDVNGKIQTLANSVVLTSRIINFTESGFVEIPLQIAVPYTSDLERMRKIILEVVKKSENILPNVSQEENKEIRKLFRMGAIKEMFASKFNVSLFEPKIYTTGISFPKINLEIRIWIRSTDKRDKIVSDFLDSLVERFKKDNIELV